MRKLTNFEDTLVPSVDFDKKQFTVASSSTWSGAYPVWSLGAYGGMKRPTALSLLISNVYKLHHVQLASLHNAGHNSAHQRCRDEIWRALCFALAFAARGIGRGRYRPDFEGHDHRREERHLFRGVLEPSCCCLWWCESISGWESSRRLRTFLRLK